MENSKYDVAKELLTKVGGDDSIQYDSTYSIELAMLEKLGGNVNKSFDSEYSIMKDMLTVINSGGGTVNNQDKTVEVIQNGQTSVTADSGFTGLGTVTINTNVPQPSIQDNKSQDIVANGPIEITPDETFDAMSKVTLNVSVPAGTPNLQNKSITITSNTTTNVAADPGFDGLGNVTVITNIELPTQAKSIEITTNGATSVTPDEGFDGLSQVNINVNVPTGEGQVELGYTPKFTSKLNPGIPYTITIHAQWGDSYEATKIGYYNGPNNEYANYDDFKTKCESNGLNFIILGRDIHETISELPSTTKSVMFNKQYNFITQPYTNVYWQTDGIISGDIDSDYGDVFIIPSISESQSWSDIFVGVNSPAKHLYIAYGENALRCSSSSDPRNQGEELFIDENNYNAIELHRMGYKIAKVNCLSGAIGANSFFECWFDELYLYDLSSSVDLSNAFILSDSNHSIRELYISKLPNIDLSGWGINNHISLSKESLLRIIYSLPTSTKGYSCSIGSTNLAKLTPEEIQVATDKGWTLN